MSAAPCVASVLRSIAAHEGCECETLLALLDAALYETTARKQNNESIPVSRSAPDANVWLLAGLNVAILGVRAAIDMRGVAMASRVVPFIFCAFHPMFSKRRSENAQRIADLRERQHVVRFFDCSHHDGDHDVWWA